MLAHPTFERLMRRRAALSLVGAVVVPFAVGLALVPLRGTFANAAAALTMVAVIAAVAVAGNRVTGVVASFSAAIWFDFYLTPPYLRLTISHRPDLETTIAILIVGIFITELAARSRHHWRAANSATKYVAMIHSMAMLAADSAPAANIIERACASLIELLSLRACRFDRGRSDPPLARIQSDGDVTLLGMRWPAKEIGLPGPEAEILAQWRGRVVGRFVVTPTPGAAVSLEQRIVAVSLVEVIAAYVMDEHHAH
jgi:hypothetical protein